MKATRATPFRRYICPCVSGWMSRGVAVKCFTWWAQKPIKPHKISQMLCGHNDAAKRINPLQTYHAINKHTFRGAGNIIQLNYKLFDFSISIHSAYSAVLVLIHQHTKHIVAGIRRAGENQTNTLNTHTHT